MPSRLRSLDALLVDGLRDLLDGERQLQDALRQVLPLVESAPLAALLRERSGEIDEHARRIVFSLRALRAGSLWKRSIATEGLLSDVLELLNEDAFGIVADVAVAGCLERLSHYEIAASSTLVTYAETLNRQTVATLLARNIADECRFAAQLTQFVDRALDTHEAKAADQTVSGGVRVASGGGSWTGTGGGSSVGVTGGSSGRSVSSA